MYTRRRRRRRRRAQQGRLRFDFQRDPTALKALKACGVLCVRMLVKREKHAGNKDGGDKIIYPHLSGGAAGAEEFSFTSAAAEDNSRVVYVRVFRLSFDCSRAGLPRSAACTFDCPPTSRRILNPLAYKCSNGSGNRAYTRIMGINAHM